MPLACIRLQHQLLWACSADSFSNTIVLRTNTAGQGCQQAVLIVWLHFAMTVTWDIHVPPAAQWRSSSPLAKEAKGSVVCCDADFELQVHGSTGLPKKARWICRLSRIPATPQICTVPAKASEPFAPDSPVHVANLDSMSSSTWLFSRASMCPSDLRSTAKTSMGGFRPSLCARCHRFERGMPVHGYFRPGVSLWIVFEGGIIMKWNLRLEERLTP